MTLRVRIERLVIADRAIDAHRVEALRRALQSELGQAAAPSEIPPGPRARHVASLTGPTLPAGDVGAIARRVATSIQGALQ